MAAVKGAAAIAECLRRNYERKEKGGINQDK